MKLLIVDDEIYAIKGILDSVDWEKCKFDEILTANSYSQAVNILSQKEIAVMLCDIEMPMGSGLELAEWVGEHSPDTRIIILSCHDEFHFARKAVALECMEYILKPASSELLVQLFQKARQQYSRRKEEKRYVEYGKRYIKAEGETEQGEAPEQPDIVSRTEWYIKTHISDSLNVEELARMVYMNPDYLSRLFKKKHNKSLIEYITQERMTLAAEMLRHSNMTVSMVAAKVGYPNYSYFTRIFRKYHGVTPREFASAANAKTEK